MITAALVTCIWTLTTSASEPPHSRSFNGVVASFHIQNPVVKPGDELTVAVVYRNTGAATVTFRFLQADEDAEVYRRGSQEQILKGCVGEPAPSNVTLGPGKSARFEQTFSWQCWDQLRPGDYEVRFCYHLGLLADESERENYQRKYPHDGYVVPWEDSRHRFTVTKSRLPAGSRSVRFYRTDTFRGFLSCDRLMRATTYLIRLTTRTTYTASHEISPQRTYYHAGLTVFFVEAPPKLSLMSYCDQEVEISARLLPRGRFHIPTLVARKITRVRTPNT